MKLPPYIPNYDNFDKTKDQVLYSGPFWDEREINAAVKTLTEGKWLPSAVEVAKFQVKFARMFGVAHSHMVNSGSSANLVMITAMKKYRKWDDGSEIIVSPVGFPTTIAPIFQNNMTPVFVDIEMATLNFNPDLIEEKITPKTRAIFISPVLGNPPFMDKLASLADKYDLSLIGDNCDSLGTTWKGEPITKFYEAWSCSFYPAHHICTGEGGMISSNNEALIDLCRSISWWGRGCYCVGAANMLPNGTCGKRFSEWLPDYNGILDHKYVFENMGYNLKPLDLQGSIGLVQLEKFQEIHSKRVWNYEWISRAVTDNISGTSKVGSYIEAEPSWFGVPIICEDEKLKNRLVDHFEKNRIQTRNYFAGNILIHPAYEELDHWKKYPNANKALSNVFFLGCAPFYNQNVLDYIMEVCLAVR